MAIYPGSFSLTESVRSRIHGFVRGCIGEAKRNRLRVMAATLKRPRAKRFTDLMEEQKRQWLFDPTYHEWDGSSKLLVRERARELGCPVPELYLVCDRASEIDFAGLPRRCVIKPSHLGGGQGVFLISDGKNLRTGTGIDERMIRAELDNSLACRQSGFHRNPYLYTKPKIIVEELIPNEHGGLGAHIDYKVIVIHGRVCLIQVGAAVRVHGRGPYFDYFTRDWQLVDYDSITVGHHPRKYSRTPAPEQLDRLVAWSERVAAAADKDFIRVDYLRSPTGFVLSECTMRPGPLRSKITPFADRYLGRLWQYPALVENAFDPGKVRDSDLASFCQPGFG